MLYNSFLANNLKPIFKCPHYFPIYERHLQKFINQSVVFWEIGVARGGSLQMWKRYLGPFAKIVGIDINPNCKNLEEHQISVCIGDQTDLKFLQSVIDTHGQPDIILDDGSHVMSHIYTTFNFLYDKLSKNGVYIVEDLATSYWEKYGGGFHEGTFIEKSKVLIDSLNARHNGRDCAFADSTFSMCFYDSIVVFEKMQWLKDGYTKVVTPLPEIRYDGHEKKAMIQELAKKCSRIYIYGTGEGGKEALKLMSNWGIHIEGYIVSDGYRTEPTVNNKKVYLLNEIDYDSGIILALHPDNLKEVKALPLLEKFTNKVEINLGANLGAL